MPVDNIRGVYAVGVDATLIGGITQCNNPTGTETRGESSGANVSPEFVSVVGQEIKPSFTTHDVAAAILAIGLVGQDIADLAAGLALYGQTRKRGGTREGAGQHSQYLYRDGILYLGTLSVDAGGDATLSCEAAITYDGVNDPMIVNHLASVPAAPPDDKRFALGPVTLAGVSFGQVTSLEINFGITVSTERSGSEVHPTFPSISGIAPSITIKGTDLKWMSPDSSPNDAIPLSGRTIVHADTAIYLRKRLKGGDFVPDGTAEHVKFTASGMAVIDDGMSASGGDPAKASLTLPLIYDTGTGQVPLIANAASVIS